MKRRHAAAAPLVVALVLLLLLTARGGGGEAAAHGIWGHIHVTGWAIENLPEGELKTFFDDPEVMNAALFGAAFTDSGYWPQGGELAARSRPYAEHTHWEPFVTDYIAWMMANDPPPWDDLESKRRVAFLMGCAAHGLQDELFDSLFLYQVEHHDNGNQESADPGTDGFFALDGWIRFVPEPYYPLDVLLPLYATLNAGVDEETIRRSVELMDFIYLHNPAAATSLGHTWEEALPWTRQHYLDPDIPGSLRAEVFPTAAYLQAVWDRLHGRLPDDGAVVYAFPALPRRLRSHDPATPDSWVTLVFGIGLRAEQSMPTWTNDQDNPVAFTRRGTRWGHTWPRLVRLQPGEALTPGASYTVTLPSPVELIDGRMSAGEAAFTFQVACATPDDPACPPLDAPVADIGEPNLPEPDAGAPDATPDVIDAAAEPDAAEPDAPPDVIEDVATPDAAEPDAPLDVSDDPGPSPAASTTDNDDDGCGCAQPPGRADAPLRLPGLALAAALGAVLWRRTRRALKRARG